jgi:hypothetical protein
MKKRYKIIHALPSRTPLLFNPMEDVLLDLDFDDTDEMLIYEPPLRCGGRGKITLVDRDPEDDDTER